MRVLPLRLEPGQDLRRALEQALADQGVQAAFVLSGMGSLGPAVLRLAGAEHTLRLDEELELLTLAGSLGQGPAGGHSHLHASVSLPDGRVLGGHVGYGCVVRTTAEVLLALLPDWQFTREADPATGWAELVARRTAV